LQLFLDEYSKKRKLILKRLSAPDFKIMLVAGAGESIEGQACCFAEAIGFMQL